MALINPDNKFKAVEALNELPKSHFLRLSRSLLWNLEDLAKEQGQTLEQFLAAVVDEKRGH